MKVQTRALAASIFLVIGMFLLLEGSRITLSGRSVEVDLFFLAVGAVLTIAYPVLIGDYFEKQFRTPRNISLMPMLMMLGVVLIFQAVTRQLGSIDKLVFAVLGIALVVSSVIVTYRATKKKRSKK